MSVGSRALVARTVLFLLVTAVRLRVLATLLVHQIDHQVLQLTYATLDILRWLLLYRRRDVEARRFSITLDALVAGGIVGAITFQFALSTWDTAELRSGALLLEMGAIGEVVQRLLGLRLRRSVRSAVRFFGHDGG